MADHQPVLLAILAKAYVQLGGLDWWSFSNPDDEETVGIVAVADDRERHGGLVVFHLHIDEHHQRRGYGRATLQELMAFGRRTDRCDLLRFTVYGQNSALLT